MKTMNNIYIYLCVISCIMMMSGCSDIQEYEAPVEEVFKTFYAEMETNQATKTILGQKGENGIRQVLWLPSDMIGVAPTGVWSQFDVFTNTVKESSTEAIFEGQTILADSYYAIYPYNEAYWVLNDEIDFRLSAVQNYMDGTFDSGAFPMVARSTDSDSDGLQFLNLCGVLELNLTGEEKISSITFSSDNEVSGSFTVDMNYVDYPKIVSSSNSSKLVTLNCGSGVQLNPDTPVPFYIVLPPGEYNGFNLLIKTTDGKVMCKDAKKPLDIKRSYVKSTGALPYVGVESVNLSLNGTSNCYMVSSFGSYTFDASVKGNSGESVGTPVSAEVVWETRDTDPSFVYDVIVRNVSYNDGLITFETTGAEGNALIVVKDAFGIILWSWHIWVTDTPIDQTYVNSAGTFMIQDRSVGATRADEGTGDEWKESCGLDFQWGRKDPFMGFYFTEKSGSYTLADAVANPTVKDTQWKWDNDYWSQTGKTIYDPCPVGYRVAVKETWTDIKCEAADHGAYFYFDTDPSLRFWYPHRADHKPSGISYWSEGYILCSDNKSGYYWIGSTSLFRNVDCAQLRCMREHAINVSLNTLPATDVTKTSATLRGSMGYLGTADISDIGFVWSSTNPAPDITCSKESVSVAAGEFGTSLTELKSGMTYYYRTFVTANGITIYGPVFYFTTQTSAGNEDIPEGDEYEW